MNSCAACVALLLVGVANAQPADHRIRELAGSWVVYYARAYRVPAELVEAIIDEESGWNPFAVSSKGAAGIMQLMPGTAIRFGVRNRLRLDENIHGGVAYLAWLNQRFRGDLRLVTAAYYVGVNKILGGVILFPWSEARSVLRGYAEVMSCAPKELSILAGTLTGPDGSPVAFLGPIWTGEMTEGAEFVRSLETLGRPLLSQVFPMSLAALLALYDSHVVNGRHYELRTRWLADLTPEIISTMVDGASARTSALSLVALHHFHGVGPQIAPDATAFAMRRPHFMIEIVAAWEASWKADPARHRQWATDFSSALAPLALPGGYANFLSQDAHAQIRFAYGDNDRRLSSLKRQVDPDNIFSSATPLPM
jgi:hypothetical protein